MHVLGEVEEAEVEEAEVEEPKVGPVSPVLALAAMANQWEVETLQRSLEEQMQAGEMSRGKWH